MSDVRESRAKEIQNAIREVLNRDWDPIGVRETGPKDEYDSYIGPIYRILASSPSPEKVAEGLRKIEQASMGFEQANAATLMTIAEKLLSIDLRLTR